MNYSAKSLKVADRSVGVAKYSYTRKRLLGYLENDSEVVRSAMQETELNA